MSERKSRREIDKAVRHLMEYEGPNNEWAYRLDALVDEFLAPVADELDLSFDEAADYFFHGYFSHMAFGFVFEEFATVRWDDDEHSLIDAFLQHRGWREGPAGRRYLQALAESELQFWEITAVKPGAYADIREYGTSKKSIRVKEKAATESLQQWDGLAARVLRTGTDNIFSGALLPFSPEVAARVHSVLAAVPEKVRETMQELVDGGEIEALPDNMEALTVETLSSELPRMAFHFWAVDTYVSDNRPVPELHDMDDGSFEFDGELSPELQEAMNAHLTAHYRQTLDDSIPMLNGKTPRECAADPALRQEVIGWLEYLENSNKRSSQPPYDFTWMWEELNLKRD